MPGTINRAEFARASVDPQTKLVEVLVKPLGTKEYKINILNTLRWSALAALVSRWGGMSEDTQMLMFQGKRVYNGGNGSCGKDGEHIPDRTLCETGVGRGSIVHLIYTLHGS